MRLYLLFALPLMAGCAVGGAPPPPAKTDSMPRLLKEGKVMDLQEVTALLKAARQQGQPLCGHGLTVFEGTQIERFEFEILDIMHNFIYPRHDLILFRGEHPRWLDGGNVIAGMSGSPCYVNDKLIGALSYTMGFYQKRALGGITPIEYMIREMDRPTELGRAFEPAPNGPVPVRTPLHVRGVSPRVLRALEPEFEKHHFLLAGSGSGSALETEVGEFQPGSAIGAQLMNGDYDFTAIGTVTFVEGDKVLAFGHPFFNSGEISLPITTAVIHTTFTGLASSFKLGSPVRVVGSLVHDRPHAIFGRIGKSARMIPVTIVVTNPNVKTHETVKVNVLDHPLYTPFMIQIAMSSSVDAFEPSDNPRLIASTVDVRLAGGRAASFESVSSIHPLRPFAGGAGDALGNVMALLQNEYEAPAIESVDVVQEVVNENRSATLKEAWPMADEVEDGGTVRIRTVLRQFRGAEKTKDIEVKLPRGLERGSVVKIQVGGGAHMAPERAPASNLEEFIESLQKDHRANTLVAVADLPSYNLQYKGRILDQMPNSVLAQIVPSLDEAAFLGQSRLTASVDTDWVVSGAAEVAVRIR
ncbi:MAG: hypothetical protein HY716_08965 [Planctomycetes bacterium]|nr:hypothetical protein [Planctomycetota bacterium]